MVKTAFGPRLLRGEKEGTSRASARPRPAAMPFIANVVAVIRMSNIDIELTGIEIQNDKAIREGAAMTANLHVSFPDEMHAE
ncbi:hypothetical protein [Shinella fusca]|jgi:hypothetical protein|uniref:Uncharacterized protein n=1 Tax=Shinella fusca TaxID=544480 RepID=A0A7W8DWT7_9HYPH|nr:hypothetical protein [Shinella fusca]MBB5045062.1 hypothetical protein [Shinella fusca]